MAMVDVENILHLIMAIKVVLYKEVEKGDDMNKLVEEVESKQGRQVKQEVVEIVVKQEQVE
ncbi:conserved hypothetical protein [Ricinus communis]|uniref:Uncharacterized protein n=1 Tax=Ricinus communis TaxID=3988 RepID=B9SDU3_RICCO|nr:conserved hypothetical protein [Ricinus communis]